MEYRVSYLYQLCGNVTLRGLGGLNLVLDCDDLLLKEEFHNYQNIEKKKIFNEENK